MKAFKDKNDQVRLFRPDMNMKRFNLSCDRLEFPTFCPEPVSYTHLTLPTKA